MPDVDSKYMRELQSRSVDIKIEKRSDSEENDRIIQLSFSSEQPVMRGFGKEILDHNPGSIRLDRINGSGALLVNHREDDQVGVVERAWVDADRRARALVRFGTSKRAEEIYQDVKTGIRKLVSARYKIHDLREETARNSSESTYRITDWEPVELSIVAVPADSTVGVGRSETFKKDNEMPKEHDDKKDDQKRSESTPKPEEGKREFTEEDARNTRENVRRDELKRMSDIDEIADKFDADELGRKAIEEGTTVEGFRKQVLELVGERNAEARSESKFDGNVDMSKKDTEKFSLFRALYALSNPNDPNAQKAAAFEFEVSQAAAKAVGGSFEARGLYIPENVLERTLTAGVATDGKELVAEDLLAGSFVDLYRNSLITARAGVTHMPGLVGNVLIPRQVSGAVSQWLGAEGDDAQESEPQFDQIALSPKDLACYTEITRRLMMQSTPAAEGLVRRDLAYAQASGIDTAILYGTGAAGQPLGIDNVTGINSVTFAAAAPTYQETISMVKETMLDNALIGGISYLLDPNGWENAMVTEKFTNTGKTIMSENGTINGYTSHVSNQIQANDWFFGNFSDAIVGEWGGFEITVDPYTKALSGGVRFIVFKTADTVIRHPGAFCKGSV